MESFEVNSEIAVVSFCLIAWERRFWVVWWERIKVRESFEGRGLIEDFVAVEGTFWRRERREEVGFLFFLDLVVEVMTLLSE